MQGYGCRSVLGFRLPSELGKDSRPQSPRRTTMTDAKTFLKQLRATLKQHGFQRLNANNYFHRAEFLLCLFTIQKSMYIGQYYFDVYYRLADDDPKEKN